MAATEAVPVVSVVTLAQGFQESQTGDELVLGLALYSHCLATQERTSRRTEKIRLLYEGIVM